jgi:formate dehydrogenase subunit gamma
MNLSQSAHLAIAKAITSNRDKAGPLLPILHAIQDEIGYVPPESVEQIAAELNLSRAEVYGVLTFYHHFRQSPPGRHTVQICQAESCQAMGCVALTTHAKALLGIDFHQTTADQEFSLEPVYCLGNCACSPSLMIDEEVFGRVSNESLEKLFAEMRKEQQ